MGIELPSTLERNRAWEPNHYQSSTYQRGQHLVRVDRPWPLWAECDQSEHEVAASTNMCPSAGMSIATRVLTPPIETNLYQ